MINDYYNKKIIRMGTWNLKPLDSENWHGEETAKHFKEHFGFGKGI